MQIPHHGSRRNITESLIEYFCPKSAFASASGNAKHPRQEVVEAFQKVGTIVYSTHYPHDGHLLHRHGAVPQRQGYATSEPLPNTEG
jgi:beta-lactamase superfamily II metal-dependent hydrolase